MALALYVTNLILGLALVQRGNLFGKGLELGFLVYCLIKPVVFKLQFIML